MLTFSTPSRSALAGLSSLASLVYVLAACGDDKVAYNPLLAVTLETTVTPASVQAGERAQVGCTLLNGRGEPLAGGTFTVDVDPVAGAIIDGTEVFSNVAGDRKIACGDAGTGLVDLTPADLQITPGPATKTLVGLTPSTVAAGDPSTVACVAHDQFGNIASADLALVVTPDTTVTLSGIAEVSATAVGTYEVLCSSPSVPAEQRAKATLTVVPSERVGIGLKFTPPQAAYRLLQQITVVGFGVDEFGNPIAGDVPIATLDAAPVGHHKVLGDALDKIRFDLEGKYTISATAKDIPGQSGSALLAVDQTAPVIVLSSPERGLVTDSLSEVVVAGTVIDNLGEIAELRIGYQSVPVPKEGGAFSARVPLRYATNLLDVHAVDPYGLERIATRAVEKSTEYRPMTERNFEVDGIDNGLVLVLLQEAFDDGDHTEATRDDLAHLFEFIIENLDFTSFLPTPLTSFSCIGGQCTVNFTTVTMDDVKVTMTLVPGRIRLRVELVKLAGVITLFFPCDVPVICAVRPVAPLPGTIATNSVVLTTDIIVSIVNGQTQTTAENTQVGINGLDVSIPDPTGIGQAAIDLVVTFIRDPLIAAMQNLVVSLVEDQVANALNGLFAALTFDTTFDLPSPVDGLAPNTLVLKTQPKGIDIAPERLQLRVEGLAYAQTPRRPHPHLGSISHAGCAPPQALTFPPAEPSEVGLHDDLINQLLFAIWEGGTLDLDLNAAQSASLVGNFGLENALIKVDALLPPVFDSCGADGIKKKEVVQLGDLYLEAQADFAGEPIHLGLWILTEAAVTVDIALNDAGALAATLVIGDLDPMWIEVVINEGAFSDNDQAVVDLVQNTLIPQLLGTVSDSLTFVLPSIDLGALTSAVPTGTIINLDVRAVGRDSAFLTVQGGLK